MKRIALAAVMAGMLVVPAAQAQTQLPPYAQAIGEDMMIMYIFGRLDTNKDGQVSAAELSALHTAADADGSGQVSLKEMIQHKEREKDRMFQTLTGKRP